MEALRRVDSCLAPGLMSGLRNSQLGSAVASVYKLLIQGLSMQQWLSFFEKPLLEAVLSSDELQKQHVLTLLLPATVMRFPALYTHFIKEWCFVIEDWLVIMAMMRAFRDHANISFVCDGSCYICASGLHGLPCTSLPISNLSIEQNKQNTENIVTTSENAWQNIVEVALEHANNLVRAEGLAFLCQTNKASQPITTCEARLLRKFFSYNTSVDCAVFRQSLLKSFRHLISRLSYTIAKELKGEQQLLAGDDVSASMNWKLRESSKLVVWFIRYFYMQMESNCLLSYQRRLTCMKMYCETVQAFLNNGPIYNFKKRVKSNHSKSVLFIEEICNHPLWRNQDYLTCYHRSLPSLRCAETCSLNLLCYYKTTAPNQPKISQLLLPNFSRLITDFLLDDMEDVRQEAEQLVLLLGHKAWGCQRESSLADAVQVSRNDDAEIAPIDCCGKEARDNSVAFVYEISFALEGCSSPKANVAESHATLLKLLIGSVFSLPAADSRVLLSKVAHCVSCTSKDEQGNDCNLGSNHSLCSLFTARVRQQLNAARQNTLLAATEHPIFGTLLVIDGFLRSEYALRFLSEACVESDISSKISCLKSVVAVKAPTELRQLVDLCADIVDFVLSQMSLTSKGGGAPSFEEISTSFDLLVKQGLKPQIFVTSNDEIQPELSDNCSNLKVTDLISGDQFEDWQSCSLTPEHQLLLSFCWQNLKACCKLCTTIICCFYASSGGLSCTSSIKAFVEETVEKIVRAIFERTLLATRHKGAIEEAKTSLSISAERLLCHPALSEASTKILLNMLESAIKSSCSSSVQLQSSVLRRGAGLSMLVQAICVADARSAPFRRRNNIGFARGDTFDTTLLDEAVNLLLSSISLCPEHEKSADALECSRSVALHLLQPIVQQLPQCPRLDQLTSVCLTIFSSRCWQCRNASLQVFGAAVSRLVGQKRFPEDSARVNCLDCMQFYSNNSGLLLHIISLFEQCVSVQNAAPTRCIEGASLQPYLVSSAADNCSRLDLQSFAHISCEFELSAAVVPALCLVSRLSPGVTSLYKCAEDLLLRLKKALIQLLGASIFSVRSIAARAIVSVTAQSELHFLLRDLVQLMDSLYGATLSSANFIHGCLIAIKEVICEINIDLKATDRNLLVDAMLDICLSEKHCYFNKCVALEILNRVSENVSSLTVDAVHNIMIRDLQVPGYIGYLKQCLKHSLKFGDKLQKDQLIIDVLNSKNCVLINTCAEYIQEEGWFDCDGRVQAKLWQLLTVDTQNAALYLELLYILIVPKGDLRLARINLPDNFNFESIVNLVKDSSSVRYAVTIITCFLINEQLRNTLCMSEDVTSFYVLNVLSMAREEAGEDRRQCAHRSVAALLPHLATSELSIVLGSLKQNIVMLLCNALTDEDTETRRTAAQMFFDSIAVVLNDNKINFVNVCDSEVLKEVLERREETCTTVDQLSLVRYNALKRVMKKKIPSTHANIVLNELLSVVSTLCVVKCDAVLFRSFLNHAATLLSRLPNLVDFRHNRHVDEDTGVSGLQLFRSDRRNTYREDVAAAVSVQNALLWTCIVAPPHLKAIIKPMITECCDASNCTARDYFQSLLMVLSSPF